jgi:hypothetical protein
MVSTGGARTSNPWISSLPLYHCATLTHDIEAKLLVSKNAFCYSNMANLYDSGTYTYKHIYQKEYFLNLNFIFCGKP